MFHSRNKLTVFICVIVLTSAITPETLYKAKGDDVVLKQNYQAPFILSIEWKHGVDLAAEWDGSDPVYYGPFKDRCTLNLFTGALTIRGLNGSEDGVFSVAINYKELIMKLQLFVISKVPKPTISSECDTDSKSCNLTCNGDTTGAGPVNYTWFTDGSESGSDEKLKITTDTEGENFSCMMLNPVSNKTSDSFKIPIKEGERNQLISSILVPLTVLNVSALIIVLVILFIRMRNEKVKMLLKDKAVLHQPKVTDGSEVQQEPNHNGDVIKAHMKE